MARTQAGATLTRQHQRRQVALRAATLRDFTRIWPAWQIEDDSTFDALVEATVPLVESRNRTSAGLASDYYRTFRLAEDVPGQATPRLAAPPDRDQLITSLHVTGRRQAQRSLLAGLPVTQVRDTALVTMSGAVGRHVMNGGRHTLVESVGADRQAVGWARVTASDPCAFCAMLTSRGPAFRGQATAEFEAHDHCACTAEPHYEGAEWPGRAREFQALWQEHASGADDPINAFRAVIEG